MFSQWEYFIQW